MFNKTSTEKGSLINRYIEMFRAKLPFFLIPLGLAIFLLVLIGIVNRRPQVIDINLAREPISMRFLETDEDEQQQETQSEHLNIWVENSPSMAGFISTNGNQCPISFYEYMLCENPISKWVPKTVETTFYRFSPQTAAQLASQGYVDLESLEFSSRAARRRAFCEEIDDYKQQGNALTAVFSLLNTTQPNIIITDFLETAGVVDNSQLQAACEAIFKKNLSITVIALDGLFSGALYDAGMDEEYFTISAQNCDYPVDNNNNVSFSTLKKTKIKAKEIDSNSNKYHRHTRPLYMIIVGTAEQCNRYAALVTKEYKQYLDSREYSANDLEGHHRGKNTDVTFRDPMVLSFGQTGVLKVLHIIGDEINPDMTVHEGTWESTIEEIDFQQNPLHPDGISAYRLNKDSSKASQLYTIRYSFQPAIENPVNDDRYTLGLVKERKLSFEAIENPDPEITRNIVRMIGGGSWSYSLVNFEDLYQAITIEQCELNQGRVEFDLTVDVSVLEVGYYRLEIPVLIQRSQNSLVDITAMESWSVERSDVSDNPRATTDLTAHLKQILQAQRSHIGEAVPVANVTVDIEITEQAI